MKLRLLMGLIVFAGAAGTDRFVVASSDGVQRGTITFERVLDLTLKKSFKIALADEQVEAAARAWRDAKRRRLPRVNVQAWFSGDLLEFDEWGSNNFGNYLSLDWDFYQNGAIMQMIAQNWANLISAQLTRRQTVSELIYTATSLFYEALKAMRGVASAEQTLKVDEMQLRIVRLEFEQGRKTPSELADAETRVFDSRFSLTRAKQDLQRATLNLRQLVRDNTIQSVEDLPREITWTLDLSPEDAIHTALECHPGILLARSNVKLASLGEKYAKFKRWPSVRFLTGTDYAFAPLARPREFGFRAGVIVSYPLYDAGDRKSRIEDAKSGVRRANIQLLQARDQMEQQVRDSYANVSNQLDLLRLAEKRHQEVETNFAIAERKFKEKTMDELEMARIRLQYLESLQRMESLRLDALLARAKLLQSIGVNSMEQMRP